MVAMGQVWEWQEPTGKLRLMIVHRVTEGPPRRVWGIHPTSRKKLQVLESVLVGGKRGARLVRVIENYHWEPVRNHGRKRYGQRNASSAEDDEDEVAV